MLTRQVWVASRKLRPAGQSWHWQRRRSVSGPGTKRQREVVIRLGASFLYSRSAASVALRARRSRARGVKHPGIASIDGLKMLEHRQHAIILEMVHGLTVESRTASGAVPLPLALEYARQVAGVLAAAHASRIVHGSIRTSNIVITFDGPCKVLDFGLGDADRTAPGDMRGFGAFSSRWRQGIRLRRALRVGNTPARPRCRRPSSSVRALLAACLDARPEVVPTRARSHFSSKNSTRGEPLVISRVSPDPWSM